MRVISVIIFAVFALVLGVMIALDIAKARRNNVKYHVKQCIAGYIMMAPAIALTFVFVLLPIIFSLGYSFTDYNLLRPNDINFVGLKNFNKVAEQIEAGGMLFNAIKNTAFFVLLVVPLQIGLALALALFTSRKKRGVKVFKVCFFVPVVISLTVTSYLWTQILSGESSGMLNSFLGMFGVQPINFLDDPELAMPCIVIMSAWQGCGYQMLIFSSGLTNIRSDLYEAASLDGAGAKEKFFNITLPGLRSTLLYITITVFVGACRVMIQPMLMTGYKAHTVSLSYFMYQTGYMFREVGYSASIAFIMTVVIGLVTLIQRRALKEK